MAAVFVMVLLAALLPSLPSCNRETPAMSAAETLEAAKAAASRQDFVAADSLLAQLMRLHPESQEAGVAKVLRPGLAGPVAAQKATEAQRAEEAERQRAEAARQAAEQRAKDEAAAAAKSAPLYAKLRRSVDEVQNYQFFYSRKVPSGVANKFHLYIAVTGPRSKNLVFEFMYTAEDWLFIDSLTISVDGEQLPTTELGYFRVKRDNSAGRIWEWYSEPIKDSLIPLFRRIADGNRVIVRLVGQNYRHDMVLSAQQKQALREVLDAYEAGFPPAIAR